MAKLSEWRNNFRGVRWTDPKSGHTLYGAVDDILEFPDDSLAVLDYKSSGAREVKIYDSYQLQLDVYTFLLQRLGYRTAPKAYFAFFVAVKDDGFKGRLPFRSQLVAITPNPDHVHKLFKDAWKLNFTLLADEDARISKLFGVPSRPGGRVRPRGPDRKDT